MDEKIQVFIISQQALFRNGIQHSLSSLPDLTVNGASEINEGVLTIIDNLPPDVALVDIDGAPDAGLNLARKVKQHSPSIAIVVLASNPNDEQLFEVLKGQAASYLSKETTPERLIETIRRVARGEHPINESLTTRPKVAEQVLLQFQELSRRTEAEAFLSPLTPREMEILKFIGQGFLNKQIAAELGISEQTIKNHVTSILRKLNANARTEAVVLALKQGLITIK
ncbi:MAG: two component transcriptional regulator, LuxR family [Chloroflexi bacterium]|jgi:DNA-binding NarL/FixJ family response regulator|nr:two component transcriptional regulator, LuxR family [Chloroflexota bacterium]